MPYYCVNPRAQFNGDHEVHDLTPGACPTLPNAVNQLPLGYHPGCHSAVAQAKRTYPRANGCAYCCPPCHTS